MPTLRECMYRQVPTLRDWVYHQVSSLQRMVLRHVLTSTMSNVLSKRVHVPTNAQSQRMCVPYSSHSSEAGCTVKCPVFRECMCLEDPKSPNTQTRPIFITSSACILLLPSLCRIPSTFSSLSPVTRCSHQVWIDEIRVKNNWTQTNIVKAQSSFPGKTTQLLKAMPSRTENPNVL